MRIHSTSLDDIGPKLHGSILLLDETIVSRALTVIVSRSDWQMGDPKRVWSVLRLKTFKSRTVVE